MERYYTINEFISVYDSNMELWQRYLRDREENSWSMFVSSGTRLKELLAQMVRDADDMSEEGFLRVQSIRNLYHHYDSLARAPLEPKDEMKRELQLWEISELMKRYTEELLQDNLTFGNRIHEDIRRNVVMGQQNAFLLMTAVMVVCIILGAASQNGFWTPSWHWRPLCVRWGWKTLTLRNCRSGGGMRSAS